MRVPLGRRHNSSSPATYSPKSTQLANAYAGYSALISMYSTKAPYKSTAHLPLHIRSGPPVAPDSSPEFAFLDFAKKKIIAQLCIVICCNYLPRRLHSHLPQLAPRKIDGSNYTSEKD